jgi:hypothetical protein
MSDVRELRPVFDAAWIVAKRRLTHPDRSNRELPLDNIAAVIEMIVDELFEQVEDVE